MSQSNAMLFKLLLSTSLVHVLAAYPTSYVLVKQGAQCLSDDTKLYEPADPNNPGQVTNVQTCANKCAAGARTWDLIISFVPTAVEPCAPCPRHTAHSWLRAPPSQVPGDAGLPVFYLRDRAQGRPLQHGEGDRASPNPNPNHPSPNPCRCYIEMVKTPCFP